MVDLLSIGDNFMYQNLLYSIFCRQVYCIENGHGQLVRDLDFNPNKQYYLATCGDDCKAKFWDIRNTSEPVKTLSDHSHWYVIDAENKPLSRDVINSR